MDDRVFVYLQSAVCATADRSCKEVLQVGCVFVLLYTNLSNEAAQSPLELLGHWKNVRFTEDLSH
jgi:hypothetical protein